ncbi:MAG: PSD1 and planctomycete cytochrome C domain-containing protein, partial [Blastocatellia bacterium]
MDANDEAEVLFIRRIAPLLQAKCLACHGQDEKQIKGKLDLRSRAGLRKGGASGQPALIPGQPEASPLYLAVTRAAASDWSPMPPKEADQLNAEQVAWIRHWIAAGAPWPDAARARELTAAHADQWAAEDGIAVKTSGGLSPDWTNRKYKPEGLWAYQPAPRPVVKPPANRNPIDALLAARLPAGLPLAPLADRVTLIRRANFDLTGLPPAPAEVAAFLRDPLPEAQAFANVVERLLASPHYGERMAQHWLDVVRYADSSGFANDYERGNAWRYRDYVVRSFNADKPYTQFVREQIAGDEIAPDDPEMLVATGFLRMGPWELTGMEVAKIARQRFLDDVTNSVGETFLAQSLQCARCHDHKFDPVPTRDYYAVQAVFAATQLAERPAPFLPSENTRGFAEKKYLEARRAEHLATLQRLDEKSVQAAVDWFREKGIDPTRWNAAIAQAQGRANKAREFADVFSAARNALMRQGVPEEQFPPKLYGFTPEDYGNERVARKGLERLKWELERYEPFALSVYNGYTPNVKAVYQPLRVPANRLTEGELEETAILIYGDPFALGEKVKPGVLSIVGAAPKTPIPSALEGRRKAFADWVASAENPLTTRAIVNRVWLWHFGQPLAGNPNNFGSTGKRPTHPELLDWLAATFVEQGWSVKALHRLIMNSEAYRRSAQHPDPKALAEKDPNGISYAAFKPRRLSA